MSDWNTNIIEEFRTNEGRVGGMFEKMTLLLLHTSGRRTGDERVNPLAYMDDEDRWVIFASKGGHVFHPHWLHNLEADPTATIEVGTENQDEHARLVIDPSAMSCGSARSRLIPSSASTKPRPPGIARSP